MSILRRLAGAIRAVFHKSYGNRNLDDELRDYVERAVAEKISSGMTAQQARRAVRLEQGSADSVKESVFDAGWESFVSALQQDLLYGCRLFVTHFQFSVAAVLMVAAGIAATVGVGSILYSVVLAPLPFDHPERLVNLRTMAKRVNVEVAAIGAADAKDLSAQNTVFEALALIRANTNLNLTGDGEPERLSAARITPNLLSLLRIQPVLGRAFASDEDQDSKESVVIISDRLWVRKFDRDPTALGKTIRLNDKPYTIVGVMGKDFDVPARETELWIPLVVDPAEYLNRGQYEYQALARLKPNVKLGAAQADLDAISSQLGKMYPDNRDVLFRAVPMRDELVSGTIRRSLYILFGAVGLLLLIGCVNLANLFLVRGISRAREFNLRAALGAPVGRLMQQCIAEVVPIVCAGGVLGLFIANTALRSLVPFLPATMPRLETIRISPPIIVFTSAILFATAIIVGALPALRIRRQDIADSLHNSSRGSSTSYGTTRCLEAITVAQIAMALVLLIGAGLLVRSYRELTRVNPGFHADDVLSVSIAIPRTKYETDSQVNALCSQIIERVIALPHVTSAGMVNRLPLGGVGQVGTAEYEGIDPTPIALRHINWRSVTPGYFQTMKIPLIAGRFFDDQDSAEAPIVAIVDEAIATAAWPNQDPVGKRLRTPLPGHPWMKVVGVVGRVHHDSMDSEGGPTMYWNYLQRAQDRMALVVGSASLPTDVAASVVAAIRSVDPDQPVYDVHPMSQIVNRSISQQWLNALLISMFTGVALSLAIVGIYGVTAFVVGQRQREFAIRMAVGAEQQDVVWFILRRSLGTTASGLLIGVFCSWCLKQTISTLLFNVTPNDWITITGSVVLLASVAMIASYLPARKASRTDPVRFLL